MYADLHLREAARPEGRRLVPHGHVLLQLLPGPDDDQPAVRRACSAGRRAAPESPVTQREMDLAASIQVVTEEIMLPDGPARPRQTGMKNLCLAGGVALNCVGNGRILREGPFENLWIQPAAGDAGGALGAALFVWHQLLDRPRTVNGDRQPERLAARAGVHRRADRDRASIAAAPAITGSTTRRLSSASCGLLVDEKVVGWFQGRMEFGPRALGSRSILGDARSREHAVGDEPEDQVPRIVPAVRALGAAGARGRLLRDATRASRARTCCSWPMSARRSAWMMPGSARA